MFTVTHVPTCQGVVYSFGTSKYIYDKIDNIIAILYEHKFHGGGNG